MLKKINCPSCGANLKPDAYYCDYCGAFFENKQNTLNEEQLKRFENKAPEKPIIEPIKTTKEDEEDLYKEDNFVSTEEIENSELNDILYTYSDLKSGRAFGGIIAFFIIFSFMFSGAVMETPFFTIFIIIIISGLLNKGKTKKLELLNLYKSGSYSRAYEQLNIIYQNKKSLKIVKQKILLCYYRLDKKEEAKDLIHFLNGQSHFKDEHIKDVANKLGIIYEPKNTFNI